MSESKRDQYMRHEITFHEYYGLLVEHLGEGALRHVLPLVRGGSSPTRWRELIEEDEHLNNVPLHNWDACDYQVRSLVRRSNREALTAITGSGGWSLSDSVCVLKTTAHRFAAS